MSICPSWRRSEQYAFARSVSHHNHNHTPMIYYTLTGREVERPEMDNDVRAPQRSDFPHVAATVAAHRPPRRSCRGMSPFRSWPCAAARRENSSVPDRRCGGGAGFLGTLYDPLCVDGDPGALDAVPALSRPADIAAERHDRRARLLSLVESRRPIVAAPRDISSFASRPWFCCEGNAAGAFSLAGEPQRLRDA